MADATDVTSTTSTTDKEVSNGTALDIASKDVEKPNSKNELGKDIRRHPKYGLLYEVRRYNALYHVSSA